MIFLLYAHAFFCFDGLVQAITPAPSRHQAAGEFIHDDDLAVLHHIFNIAFVQRVGPQRLVDVVLDFEILDARRVIQVGNSDKLRCAPVAFLGQRYGAMLFIDLVVDVTAQSWNNLVDAEIFVCGFVARP